MYVCAYVCVCGGEGYAGCVSVIVCMQDVRVRLWLCVCRAYVRVCTQMCARKVGYKRNMFGWVSGEYVCMCAYMCVWL